jgi:hypothetical protein
MTDHQYDTGLAVYYATYIASEIPSNLVLRKMSPKIWLPALTVMWGIVTMCLGFIKNYAGFMAVRAILGLTEGGLLPGIVSRGPQLDWTLADGIEGPVLVWDVYKRRNGAQIGPLLHCCLFEWCFWWLACKRAHEYWEPGPAGEVELDIYH